MQITFVPQITIQHSLQNTMPLIFSLFDNDDTYSKNFMKAFPDYNNLLNKYNTSKDQFNSLKQVHDINYGYTIKDTHKFTKMDGFLFLHTLTWLGLIPKNEGVSEALNDRALIAEMVGLSEKGQVSPKIRLDFLSRRPFSEMWKSIKQLPQQTFRNLFEVIRNGLIEEIKNFKYVNYANEFYEGVPLRPKDLSYLKDCFTQGYDNEFPKQIESLLKQGILSTSMIRLMDKEKLGIDPVKIFKDYFEQMIDSVDQPKSLSSYGLLSMLFNIVISYLLLGFLMNLILWVPIEIPQRLI